MIVIFNIIFLIEFLFGIVVLFLAKSAVHEILATLMIGFSFLTLILTEILSEIKKITAITKENLNKKI